MLTSGLKCRQDEKGGNDSDKHFTQDRIPKPDSIANLSQEELNAMEKAMVRKADIWIMPIIGILYILNCEFFP